MTEWRREQNWAILKMVLSVLAIKRLWRRQLVPVVLSPDFTLTFSVEFQKMTDIGILPMLLNLGMGPGHWSILRFLQVIPVCFRVKNDWFHFLCTLLALFEKMTSFYFQIVFLIRDGGVKIRKKCIENICKRNRLMKWVLFRVSHSESLVRLLYCLFISIFWIV